jgi:stage V sporulation protein S
MEKNRHLLMFAKSITIFLRNIGVADSGSDCTLNNKIRREANVDVIKVSGTSRTSAVAGAIAGVVRENKRAEVQAIGASAVNQAVKALTLAKGYLATDGFDIVFTPEFVDVDIDGKVRTAIRFVVEPR